MSRPTIGLVGAGEMGSAVGAAYAAGGARVVTSLAGRSDRTRRFVVTAGLEVLSNLDAVVRAADVMLSIVPPEHALRVASDLAAAARRTGATPLVGDLNAISPQTVHALAELLAGDGLELVDGSISGGPPRPEGSTRLYLAGPRARELAVLPAAGLDARIAGEEVGAASAVKMCTASVYKGTVGLLAHALATAHANGVLEQVLDDLRGSDPKLVEQAPASIARAGAKSRRYVAEMREIAATQAAAGLPSALFEGFAATYGFLAETPLVQVPPEAIDVATTIESVLERLLRPPLPRPP